MRQELVAAGFGGQGIILLGITACVAAGLYDGKMVAQTQSYGPASRGGACRTDVVISDEEIDYAKALSPDVMVLMSEQARDSYLSEVRPQESIVIIDSTLVKEVPNEIRNVYYIPATEIAEIKFGQSMVANMVMLGAISAITELFSYEALKGAIKDVVNNKFIDVNLKALAEGYEYGKSLVGGTV
ncbi:Pyruvate-flavodoxin oxidoreductase, central domain [Moorella glycerini]|uniref:Pyruvate synthase subunit PorC n=1 Tax=Neomoorella stamsii TaxID=1266720 RepID=A0A9X7P7A1_9FIRM|nr:MULTISPECIES: 2-oxoacid:acceptor oxidoreductase family protein [Moorella]PRR76419.1 Pyruvate synthase subunit PorC [Moorella stamsii]CEP67012.1 Pyruvate-flavodoxin oxidoreductase, central domain [Moorella glycerini]